MNEDERQKEMEAIAEEHVKEFLEKTKETYKIDYSVYGKPLETKQEIRQRKKEEREFRKEFRDKPSVLVSLAGVLSKLFPFILTVYTFLLIPILYFAWQIYKMISADGWQAVLHTKYTLYVVCYFAVFALLKIIYHALYKYAND